MCQTLLLIIGQVIQLTLNNLFPPPTLLKKKEKRKAFNTTDHNILFNKLERLIIRGVGLNWVLSYLRHMYQFSEIDDCQMNTNQRACGVPQGLVIGPTIIHIIHKRQI